MNGSTDYLEFLEREFAKEQSDDDRRSGSISPGSQPQVKVEARWSSAAASIQPRSWLSGLFGVTKGDIRAAVAILSGTPQFSSGVRIIRRSLELLISLSLIILFLPLIIAIAIAVAIDGRPVFTAHTRIGVHGVPFKLLKFRTVKVAAAPLLATLADGYSSKGVLFKTRDDYTNSLGRWLRRTSLDELPQLFNILMGDMSFVGPRAPLPEEVAQYDIWRGQLLLKPGMTGLWTISGKRVLSPDEMLRLDQRYVENWSLFLDLVILWNTVKWLLSPTVDNHEEFLL